MIVGTTALERAFALASSGRFETLFELERALGREGYERRIDGPVLRKQLLALLKDARSKPVDVNAVTE